MRTSDHHLAQSNLRANLESFSVSKTVSVIRRALACAIASTALSATTAFAGGAGAEAAPAEGGIALELNKLEAYDKGCRALSSPIIPRT